MINTNHRLWEGFMDWRVQMCIHASMRPPYNSHEVALRPEPVEAVDVPTREPHAGAIEK